MQKWEYLSVYAEMEDDVYRIFANHVLVVNEQEPRVSVWEDYLNKLGDDGWELVTTGAGGNCYFKRPRE